MSSPMFDTSGSVTGPPATFRHRHHRRHSHAHGHGRSLSTRIKYQVRHYLNRYHSASKQGKAIFWGLVLFHVVLIGAIAIITPRRIGLFFTHVAEGLRELGPGGIGGMAILFLCVVLASHPPLFGFAGSMTLIGFTYGLWPYGILLAVCASMTGSAVAFISIRTFFLRWMQRFGSERSDKWQAFGHVVKAKGIPLLMMIRWCPLPWAIGNGLFASIPSVTLPAFLLANLAVQPRLLVPVFIGSRMKSLAGEGGEKDSLTKWINAGSILVGLAVSVTTGLFIYRATLAKMDELERSGVLSHEEVINARDLLEENALLGDYSGESSSDDQGDDTVNGGGGGDYRGSGQQQGRLTRNTTAASAEARDDNDQEEVDFGAFKSASSSTAADAKVKGSLKTDDDDETRSATGTLRDIERELASHQQEMRDGDDGGGGGGADSKWVLGGKGKRSSRVRRGSKSRDMSPLSDL